MTSTTDDGRAGRDASTNRSANLSLHDIIAQRYSRRETLVGSIGATAAATFGTALLAACGSGDAQMLTVSAGQNRTSSSGRMVTLTGTGSGGGAITSSAWTQVSGTLGGRRRQPPLRRGFAPNGCRKGFPVLCFVLYAAAAKREANICSASKST